MSAEMAQLRERLRVADEVKREEQGELAELKSELETARRNLDTARDEVARQTEAALIYKRTKNIRAIQLLLGHTKLKSTVRYLEIEWMTHSNSPIRRRRSAAQRGL